MKTKELRAIFEKHDDEFLEFDRIAAKRSLCPDLHAFMLLDELLPGRSDMVCHAEHDEIWLKPNLRDLAKVATEGQLVDLIRCGVRIDVDGDGLCMFV